ncbi:50S ribosomal protein P1 [Methanothermococcus okinawensis]|uniref:Large ribosomal subunit protein P1 n=1 Tax=Methanothermococcus okinawensis (strain DSM 14208 / JCM 11175 / IH1) TaxID=647113 RepID=F8AMI0_METOI|nr:50S ribosomal protein P1 [Methanothermococcus okinawensis]AEH06020.1 50S ribosomal protein L12P [Methanothermococcus okinawensis IH1]
MEYIYAALLLHSAGKEITEDAVKSILNAAGVEADDARVKALVAALEGVNIEEAIEKAAVAPVAAAAPAAAPAEEAKEEKKEEKKEEDTTATAAAGLGALFM